mmetsp:Transcript_41235/g.95680  ORF Transcript_41235/g.95680 Transcript_41235/m.95680 type:complete len:316 (-) Transcript_41235:1160-2107(-)
MQPFKWNVLSLPSPPVAPATASAPAAPTLGLPLRFRCSRAVSAGRCPARAPHPSPERPLVARSSCCSAVQRAREGARSHTPLHDMSLSLRRSTCSVGAWKAIASASDFAPLCVMLLDWSSRRSMPGRTCRLRHRSLTPSSCMALPHMLILVSPPCTSSRGASTAAPSGPRGGRLAWSSRVAPKGLVMITGPTLASRITCPPLSLISSHASLACSGAMAVGTVTLLSLRSCTSCHGKSSKPDRSLKSTPSEAKSETGVRRTLATPSWRWEEPPRDQGPSPPIRRERERACSDLSRSSLYLRIERRFRPTASSTAVL